MQLFRLGWTVSAQSEDWKQKYRELALEIEDNQSRFEKQESILNQIIGSMVLGLEGEDAKLDLELNELKANLVHTDDTRSLARIAKGLDKHLRQRDESREKQANDILGSVQRWIRQLRYSSEENNVQNLLDSCEQRSHGITTAAYELPPLLSDLVELQAGIAADPHVAPQQDTQQKVASTIAAPSVGDSAEEQIRLLQAVATELNTLLSGLSLAREDAEDNRKLMRSIDEGIVLSDLPKILRQVIKLVGKSYSSGSEEFESYLLDLSSQLSEVENFIKDSQSEQTSIGENQRKLDLQVRSNVQQLHETVKSTHDLNELKSAVAGKLQHVVQAMDDFKRDEDQREQRLRERYENLLDKVEQMEKETREVRAHMEAEKARATTDALTGLPNRAAYDERIVEEVERWRRYNSHFSVAVGDLDFFKRINDNYGHLAGDKVLRLIAKVIRLKLRGADFIARYGGEEFVIIMPSTSVEEANKAIDKIRQAVSKSPFNFHGKPVGVTMSFGVTESQEGDNGESLFSRADELLYKAKANGRNQVVIG